jgi:DNA-binding NtrC family response regulator
LRIPPLRERTEDVAPLARAILLDIARRSRRPARALDEGAVALLSSYPWAGNARELRNALEAMTLLSDDAVLRGEQVRRFFQGQDPGGSANPFDAPNFAQYRDAADRLYFTRQIALHAGNIKRTAEALGIFRTDLYRRLNRLGLRGRVKPEGDESPDSGA